MLTGVTPRLTRTTAVLSPKSIEFHTGAWEGSDPVKLGASPHKHGDTPFELEGSAPIFAQATWLNDIKQVGW